MRTRSPLPFLALASFLAGLAVAGGPTATADAWTRVTINGTAVPVSFNDGDSFRVHGGDYDGTQCRLGGFNTLESFGPAHQWGEWHPYELYVIAKMATIHARRGTWHCFTEGEHDGYGRLLVECPDLIVDMVRRGYAQVYNVDDTASRPEYLRAQDEAIRNRAGMWAHGVPGYVMTSAHSASEDAGREWHYNRLVSTRDGHSESMRHHEDYSECEWVCADELVADPVATDSFARSLREEPSTAPLLGDLANILLTEVVTRYARIGELPEYFTGEARDPVLARLEAARAAGTLPRVTTTPGATCFLYVEFERRYGSHRASCLAGHGSLPPHVADIWHLGEH